MEVPAKCLTFAWPKSPAPNFLTIGIAAYADNVSHIFIGEMVVCLLPQQVYVHLFYPPLLANRQL